MPQELSKDIQEVLDAILYRPSVSILLPFEPKMNSKAEIGHALKCATDDAERQLQDKFPGEIGELVMQKLNKMIDQLNYNTHKKSIAIYVSPVFEKTLYLDIALETRVMVDESFEIRDLVFSKKQFHKYLLLQLSSKESKMFLGHEESLTRIISSSPGSVYKYINDIPERVANFSDPQSRRETIMNKFLLHIDNSLDIILNAYHLPLFVIGTERILGHFKKITRHNNAVIEYVPGNYEGGDTIQLHAVLAPYLNNWKKVREKNLLNRLEDAASNKKLACGMKEVWKQAMNKKGRLLLVEKDFMYPAEHGAEKESIYRSTGGTSFSYIKDAVDDVIEKVLENGGDVEFVDEDILKSYQHIALIQYY